VQEKKIPGIVRKATNDLSIYADGKKEEIVSGWRNAMIDTAGKNADSIRAQAKTDGMNEDRWLDSPHISGGRNGHHGPDFESHFTGGQRKTTFTAGGSESGTQTCAGRVGFCKGTSMKKTTPSSPSTNRDVASLFERVAGILESGRDRVLRTINHETVLAYWLIGREMVIS
jgi:hypothetical protein